MSRVLPILFNANMVRAILDGRKTVTRRIIKFPENRFTERVPFPNDLTISGNYYGHKVNFNEQPHYCCSIKKPYQTGDILYVRETFDALPITAAGHMRGHDTYFYKADGDLRPCGWKDGKWQPSIHMPSAAARIWLKVTNVKVERLQDITNEQILKEGVSKDTINSYIKQMHEETQEWIDTAYKLEWQQLWDSTVKEDWKKWNANPWVWVIEFERCEKPYPCALKDIIQAEDKIPCKGYQKSELDDEPCEMCKNCMICTGNDKFE